MLKISFWRLQRTDLTFVANQLSMCSESTLTCSDLQQNGFVAKRPDTKFFHCRAKRAGSFGECLKVALHSVVAPHLIVPPIEDFEFYPPRKSNLFTSPCSSHMKRGSKCVQTFPFRIDIRSKEQSSPPFPARNDSPLPKGRKCRYPYMIESMHGQKNKNTESSPLCFSPS